jgi:hypothetical protein
MKKVKAARRKTGRKTFSYTVALTPEQIEFLNSFPNASENSGAHRASHETVMPLSSYLTTDTYRSLSYSKPVSEPKTEKSWRT